MSFSALIPATFPALALAHFMALLSPGQDFFLITGHAIRHRLAGSWGICLGIAAGNAIYIALAILGWSSIRNNFISFTVIEFLGGCYLIWIGYHLIRSQPQTIALTTIDTPHPKLLKQVLLGLNSALLNPKNALFYMSLMAVILGNNVTFLQQTVCGVWMTFVVLSWDILIAATIGMPKLQNSLRNHLHIVERTAGIILICFAILLFREISALI